MHSHFSDRREIMRDVETRTLFSYAHGPNDPLKRMPINDNFHGNWVFNPVVTGTSIIVCIFPHVFQHLDSFGWKEGMVCEMMDILDKCQSALKAARVIKVLPVSVGGGGGA